MIEHYFYDIQGWASLDGYLLEYQDMAHFGPDPAVWVEIGCWKGKSTAFAGVEAYNSPKDIHIYCVDTWKGSDEVAHRNDPDIDHLFEVWQENTKPVSEVLTPIQSDSAKAASQFEDDSVDFILIDGDHTYGGVTLDIEAWMPKLKSGCLMVGDDLNWEGVTKAVNELLHPHERCGKGKHMYWRYRKP